jgi:hypothetical protein
MAYRESETKPPPARNAVGPRTGAAPRSPANSGAGVNRVSARSTSSPSAIAEAAHYCPGCSTRLISRGCKQRCVRCGYYDDCGNLL